jgi:DNA-binding transcriptional MerR regulator
MPRGETTGYRYYSGSQIPLLHRILAPKQIGFSLHEIVSTMARDVSTNEIIKHLQIKQLEISQNIESERKKLRQVQAYLKILEQEAAHMDYNVILKELPSVIVASMRRTIPNYDAFNEIYRKWAPTCRNRM